MNIVLGIDPGLDGAIAELTEAGELLAIHDMPTLEDGAKGRRAVNPALFASIIYASRATLAYCELVGPRPTDSTTGAFGFGRARGIIEGTLAAAGIPLAMIAPPVWKRASNIAPGKENKDSARSVAISRWPSKAAFFARKCDCDRAEAALKGARHRTTLLAEKLMQDDAEGVVKRVIEAAKGGDMTAARIVLDRIAPARRDSPVTIALPKIESAADAAKAMAAILAAVASGAVTPSEAEQVAKIVAAFVSTLEASEFEARLRALEKREQGQ